MLPSSPLDDDVCDQGCTTAAAVVKGRGGGGGGSGGSGGLQWRSVLPVMLASLPFLLTFGVVFLVASEKLYPALAPAATATAAGAAAAGAGSTSAIEHDHDYRAFSTSSSPSSSSSSSSSLTTRLRSVLRRLGRWPSRRKWPSRRRWSAVTFATTIALTAVLAELILCEISNAFDPVARALILRLAVSSLLVLLIVVTPALELQSLISSAGWEFRPTRRARWRVAWFLELFGMTAWLAAFWWIGQGLPGTQHPAEGGAHDHGKPLSEACLERVGIVGISLMALLSGFASVSSLWQTFGVKARPVTEADLARKESGLDATHELLESKCSRLRALERKLSDAPDQSLVGKVIGSLRGHGDVQERKMLRLEIDGLETMSLSLSSSLALLRSRRREQARASTAAGRVLRLASHGFSLYCLYRILATSVATLRRWWHPDATFSGTDPITNLLALVAKHWDPSLDRLGWSRQIAFGLSGVILLGSFNSVWQTMHLLARLAPPTTAALRRHAALLLLSHHPHPHHHHATVAPVLLGQIAATYVISSALLLRSNVPKEVGSVISDALGAPLDSAFVDRWFESWFLTASGLTAGGILVARKVGAGAGAGLDDYDDYAADDYGAYDVEGGAKRS